MQNKSLVLLLFQLAYSIHQLLWERARGSEIFINQSIKRSALSLYIIGKELNKTS